MKRLKRKKRESFRGGMLIRRRILHKRREEFNKERGKWN
jgi:hypothetical protein